jgi:hypothetical protein
MSTLVLPVTAEAHAYEFSCTLEGRTYSFEFIWNDRSGAWFLTIRDTDGNDLAAGRRVVLGANLLGRSSNAALPPGVLLAVDTSRTDTEAGRDDLGARVKIVYIESEE